MLKIFSLNILIQLGFIIFAIISFLFIDKRYRKNHGTRIPLGFERTEEITIDPKNGKKLRVYYNPSTGERFYHEE